MKTSYSGDTKFKALLKKIGVEESVDEVKALVLGVVSGIEMVPPSHLISILLRQGEEDEVQFATEAEAQQFFGELMGLWNEMAQVGNGESPLKLKKPAKSLSASQDSLKKEAIRQTKIVGAFLEGVEIGADIDDLPVPEIGLMLKILFEQQYSSEMTVLALQNRSIPSMILKDIRARLISTVGEWEVIFSQVAEALSMVRKMGLEAMADSDEDTEEFVPQVGRNEPCPCGSGMKFKKCCMLEVVQ